MHSCNLRTGLKFKKILKVILIFPFIHLKFYFLYISRAAPIESFIVSFVSFIDTEHKPPR